MHNEKNNSHLNKLSNMHDENNNLKQETKNHDTTLNKERSEEILRKYSREDDTRRLSHGLELTVNIMAGLMSFFLLFTAIFGNLPQLRQRALYLLFAMVILFLAYPAGSARKQKGIPWYDYLFAFLSFLTCIYVVIQYESILLRIGISTRVDQIMFLVLTSLILEGTRRLVSPALTWVTIIFLLYGYFGHLAPGVFRVRTGGIPRLANHLFMIPEGIFGTPLATAATYVSVFVLFSSLLEASGMSQFIQDITMVLAGRASGGAAKMAVVASSFFGTISGAAVANVVGTGTFTIPLMKKCGYPGEFAGAVEAFASTGGQIVPPVMGAAAFVMAEYIGVPYSKIMLAALIPAALYYMSAFITVDLRSKKLGLKGVPLDQLPDIKQVMLERGHLLIPFVAVIYLIMRQYTISYAALSGIGLLLICAQMRKTTRMSLKTIVMAFVEGAKKTIGFGVSCACVGLIVGVTTMTSVGIILGNHILALSRGSLLITQTLVMVMSIILGMGMPTVAVYIVLATVAGPILVKLGVNIIAAHLFCFYFGILACITPPVAVTSYAAASLAGANPGRTGWAAFKMAIPSFLIPFVFTRVPSLLFVDTNFLDLITALVTCIISVYMIAAANERYIVRVLPKWKAALLFFGGVLSIIPEMLTDIIGISILVFIVVTERRAVRANNEPGSVPLPM